jgi:preprotein translocase subunit SecE
MARQTRQQRRARRQEQGQGQTQSTAVQRARARQQQVRPAAEAPKSQAGTRRVPGSGSRRFLGESWAELRKVEWPGQPQLIQGTAVVLIACIIVGTYLWLADLGFKRLVEHVFLGQ